MVVHIQGGKGRKDPDVMFSQLLDDCASTGATNGQGGLYTSGAAIVEWTSLSPTRRSGTCAGPRLITPVWRTRTFIRTH